MSTQAERRQDAVYWGRIEDAAAAVERDPSEWTTIDAVAGMFQNTVRADIQTVLREKASRRSWLCRIGLHRWLHRPYRGMGPWHTVDTCERCGREEPRP